ncbi:MAG: 50S ribosomal protein L10 [Methanomassiliicoccales archaeon]
MAHVAPWKRKMVEEIKDTMVGSPVLAVADVGGIPAPQMQKMRRNLREHTTMKMTRNNLISIAIDEASKNREGLEVLKDEVQGQVALLATEMNPFQLYKRLEKTKTPAPAKPGDIAPDDIVVKAGETSFPPGPFVGELQKIGVPAAIEGGKIVIKKKRVIVKAGEEIPEDVAKILPRLDILPMTVGLDLRAAFEDGILYHKEELEIPEGYYEDMLAQAAGNALRLGMAVAYPTPETLPLLISKAYREAISLSVEAVFPDPENIKILLSKADSHMLALASQAPELQDERIEKRLTSAPAAAQEPEEEKEEAEEEEEEEEEEVSEEEAAAGLGSLFG